MAEQMQGHYGDDSEESFDNFRKGIIAGNTINGKSIIETQLDRMESEWNSLVKLHHVMIEKISPVIGPERPELAAKDPGDDDMEMSTVARTIESHTEEILNQKHRLGDIIARIEC